MEEYGITFDGECYIYGDYKYNLFFDAINYAMLQKSDRKLLKRN